MLFVCFIAVCNIMSDQRYRLLPNVQKLLESEAIAALCEQYSRTETVSALRRMLDSERNQIKADESYQPSDFSDQQFIENVRRDIELRREKSLIQLINATGIIVHTNLGRAPLAKESIEAIEEASLGYSNLEFDLESGKRGSRYRHVETLLAELTGAQAAVVVNNCAASVLVSLNALCKDKEVIVSRGELVEIGGGFRMPDVIEITGAIMKEIGTTNKTRIADYENAINDNSAALLRNHCSNYKVVGFTERASLPDLVELAHRHGLYMIDDLGSGSLVDLSKYGVQDERSVQQVVASGVDAVMFSGDKLLGGPQAGIIVGKVAVIEKIKKSPLLRALRIDKLSLAALEATLALYLVPETTFERVPILKMIAQDQESIKVRSEAFIQSLPSLKNIEVSFDEGSSFIGGGSAPMNELPTIVLKLSSGKHSAEKMSELMRQHKPAVIGRISNSALVLDLRTVLPQQENDLRAAIVSLD